MRLVIDTDVMVALLAALDRRITMLDPVALMLEYEAVLTRDEHLEWAGITREDVNAFLDGLTEVIEPVALRFLWRPQLRDPGDEMVLEAAVNGRADVLVTFNARHLQGPAALFGIPTAAPGEVWRRIREGENEKK